jgi:antitoxin component YwqK of YwqJK toxin-antitoxin module
LSDLKSYWSNGVFREFVDGKLIQESPKHDGIGRWWHSNGQLSKEVAVINGFAEGVIREWHENGQLAKEEPVKRGVADGTVKQWSRDGLLLGEYEMNMGIGTSREWYDDGSLRLEMEWVADGCYRGTIWDDRGKPRQQCFWNWQPLSKKKFQQKLDGLTGARQP